MRAFHHRDVTPAIRPRDRRRRAAVLGQRRSHAARTSGDPHGVGRQIVDPFDHDLAIGEHLGARPRESPRPDEHRCIVERPAASRRSAAPARPNVRTVGTASGRRHATARPRGAARSSSTSPMRSLGTWTKRLRQLRQELLEPQARGRGRSSAWRRSSIAAASTRCGIATAISSSCSPGSVSVGRHVQERAEPAGRGGDRQHRGGEQRHAGAGRAEAHDRPRDERGGRTTSGARVAPGITGLRSLDQADTSSHDADQRRPSAPRPPTRRARVAHRSQLLAWVSSPTIAGTTVSAVSTFEKNRARHTSQYDSRPNDTTTAASRKLERNGPEEHHRRRRTRGRAWTESNSVGRSLIPRSSDALSSASLQLVTKMRGEERRRPFRVEVHR